MQGGAGFDRIGAGAGDDLITGGAGGDTFVFHNRHDGVADADTITDYRFNQIDVLDLVGGRDAVASDRFSHGAWELVLKGDGDVIRLLGVTDSDGNGHITDNLLFA